MNQNTWARHVPGAIAAPLPVFLAVALAACGGDAGGGAGSSSGMTGSHGTDSDGSTSSSSASDSGATAATGETSGGPGGSTSGGGTGAGTDSTSGGPPKFDVGTNLDAPNATDGGEGCAKVDLLFVVDNSVSMFQEQANLIANFPTFSGQIQTQLADVDSYHLMVTSTDDYQDLGYDRTINDDDGACQVIGASITKSAAGVCAPYAEGQRYMTTQDDLDARFACAADLGTGGSMHEKVGDAMVAAVSPALNGAGGCQEGFLRSDALLIIVILTDEDDAEHSVGGPGGWYDGIVAAKNGLPDNVVVLAMIWDDRNGNPHNCTPEGGDAEIGTTIIEFTNMFTNGVVGSVCAADYGPFFLDAVSVIDSACDGFEPPG